MLKGTGKTITMTEGDYGLHLPIKINGINISAEDSIKLSIKNEEKNVYEKEYKNVENNTIDFCLEKADSLKLTTGNYIYLIDWYKDNKFFCNIVNGYSFNVNKRGL